MLTTIKLFLRSIKRNKLFSFVNALGLTVGFFASILIYLYVQNELSYDQFHEKGDRIYRVNQTFIWGDDNPNLFSSTGPGVGYAITQEIPEAEQVVRVFTADGMLPISFEAEDRERLFNDEYVLLVDSNFLEVFSFPLLHGDPKTCLDQPYSVVLTYQTAEKFFGNHDVVGRRLSMDDGEVFQVTGVFEKMEENSYLDDFDLLASMGSVDRVGRSNDNWMWTMFETFVLVNENADFQQIQGQLDQLPRKHATETLKWMGYTYDEYLEAGKEWNLYLQPLKDIYLHSDGIYNRISGVGDFKIVAALIGSAIFLVILSCINFINLSTAQFTTKAHDVALRKVLGGSKSAFIRRFFGEALAYCVISCFLAVGLLVYAIPFINQSLGTNLELSLLDEPSIFVFLIAMTLAVSVIAGLYPFSFFNSFKPIMAMKGEMKTGRKGVRVRNGMLVAQYCLSFILIIGTITIYDQLNYFMNADLGFEKDNLLVIENAHWSGSIEDFANELKSVNDVTGTSICDAIPLLISNGDQFQPDIPNRGSVPLNYALGDESYLDLLEVEMLVGRNFDATYATDTSGVILNETAARTIGWVVDESILNRKIENWSGEYHVIGVTRDFNFWTLHAPIEPFAIFHSSSNAQGARPLTRVLVKSRSSETDFKELKKDLESKWSEFVPNRPYEQVVINDHFATSYETEQKFGSVLAFFALLTIIIASLGLFGIVVFTVEQKLKEIGVRKVLGASASSLIVLFSKSYVKLLIVAFMISVPIGYYFMESWLSDFEYRIVLTPWIFMGAFGLLLVISLAISIFHTMRASMLNPADVLKDE